MKCPACGSTSSRRWLAILAALGTWAAFDAGLVAQSPPQVTGTIALEGTVHKFYRAANVIIVKTLDGVEHVLSFAKDLVVHGDKGPDPLAGLQEGRTVVVHYTIEGIGQAAQEIDRLEADDITISEGTVVRVDRSRRQITIRFNNGTSQTLRLTERAAADVSTGIGDSGVDVRARVLVVDEDGQRVVHYFRRVDKRSNQR